MDVCRAGFERRSVQSDPADQRSYGRPPWLIAQPKGVLIAICGTGILSRRRLYIRRLLQLRLEVRRNLVRRSRGGRLRRCLTRKRLIDGWGGRKACIGTGG